MTPTNDSGSPAASTPDSMAGDSILASPTTATSERSSSPSETQASRSVGGSACSSSDSGLPWSVTGRKKSRCRTVCVTTNAE